MVPLAEIQPYWRNPRDNAGAVAAVKASILEFGFQQPLVLDKDNIILVGHTRFRALTELGVTEVPCIIADLPADKAKAYRIADNKAAEFATWDPDKMIAELREIGDLVDMGVFFQTGELESYLAVSTGSAVKPVTAGDVTGAAAGLENRMTDASAAAQATMVEVTCPHCAEVYFLNKEDVLKRYPDARGGA